MSKKSEHPMVDLAEVQIRDTFFSSPNAQLLYHNIGHTNSVVEASKEIGKAMKLSDEGLENVLIAAWFHDSEYRGGAKDHENRAAESVELFLQKHQIAPERIESIKSMIMVTQFGCAPKNLEERVICDADLIHLGKKEFMEVNKLLRAETEMIQGHSIPDLEWYESNLSFLSQHYFQTPYTKENYQKRKNKNVLLINELKKEAEAKVKAKLAKEAEKREKEHLKQTTPERGIETMFRMTSRNHMELSNMADNKANIMITINSIIISIVAASLLPKLDKNVFLIVPTFLLLATCLGAIIFATISTRPKISGGTFTKEDVKAHKVNLLFFGNFFKMSFKDYDEAMGEMLQSRTYLYGALTQDIYGLGQVLAKKYRLIRIAYNIFMGGLVLTVLAFALAFVFWSNKEGVTPGIPDLG
jgi:HD-GYP domain-containing protein (c-di-GMP phosphodiesterase class II)